MAAKQSNTKPDELVTPEEHAEVTKDVDATTPVASDEVPTDVEIGARSADADAPTNDFEKVFVLGPNPYITDENPYTEAHDYDHEPNKTATRQYAIDHGLWPTGDVRFVSGKKHPDGVSWILSYAVPVIPAHLADNGETHPHVVDDDGDAENAINYADNVSDENGDKKTAAKK